MNTRHGQNNIDPRNSFLLAVNKSIPAILFMIPPTVCYMRFAGAGLLVTYFSSGVCNGDSSVAVFPTSTCAAISPAKFLGTSFQVECNSHPVGNEMAVVQSVYSSSCAAQSGASYLQAFLMSPMLSCKNTAYWTYWANYDVNTRFGNLICNGGEF